jgi:nucleoside-diphosphate-sugar epimerase
MMKDDRLETDTSGQHPQRSQDICVQVDPRLAADIILRCLGKEAQRDNLIVVKHEEVLTTREKKVDCSKARRDLDLKVTVSLEEGIHRTLDWMKKVYRKH